jgi:hypothetical protein
MSDEALKQVDELYVEPANDITQENTYLDKDSDTIQFRDDAAVKLVIDDAARADNFINVNQWASGWTLTDIIYQSPATQSVFDGGNVGQANVPKFILSNHISTIVPKVMGGIFYEDPPFMLRPLPDTTNDDIRAKTALYSQQLSFMKFEQEVERTVTQMSLFGTGIMKWGYSEYHVKTKKRVRTGERETIENPDGTKKLIDNAKSDQFEIKREDKLVSHPWIKFCDIRTVLVDPGCRVGDIRQAKWVVYRDYATYEDLDRLRDVDGYNIPDDDVLKALFFQKASGAQPDNITMTMTEGMLGYLQHAVPRSYKTSSDPQNNPMEILERWDADKVIVVLSYEGHNILIRNEENPYAKIPFLSANWRDIQDSFYGQGLGLLIGSEQLVEQGITNLALDLLNYGLQPTAVRKKGWNTPTQNQRWKLGGIIDVEDDVDKAFKFMTMPPVPGEAWQFIQQAQTTAATASGANEFVEQGASASGTKTTGMRSATGASAVIQANASRLDGPTSRFTRQIFEPWMYIMDELVNDLLPTQVMREILGKKLGDDFQLDHESFRNAEVEFEALVGSKLGAKKSMAQFLPIALQMMTTPAFTKSINDGGYTFDGPAIFQSFADAAGFKFSQPLMRKFTPQEQQAYQGNQPAAIQQKQLAAQQAAQQAQFQHEKELEDMKQLGKAGAEVLRASTEHALNSELTGTPSSSGFGADQTI